MATTMRMRGTLELVAKTVQSSTPDWTNHSRTQVLMLLPRSERIDYEEHPGRINLARPAWSMYFRPRSESTEIGKTGIEPRSVSFHFLDIAMEDLGRWVGPLVSDGWQRTEVVICAANGISFEDEIWTCFHHPFIPTPTRLPLTGAPTKLDVNCYIHQPTGVIKPATKTSGAQFVEAESETKADDGLVNSVEASTELPRPTPARPVADNATSASPTADHAPNNNLTADSVMHTSAIGESVDAASSTKSPTANVAVVEERTDEGEPAGKTAEFPSESVENSPSESVDESRLESAEEPESIGQDDDYEPPTESETKVKLRQMIQLLKADGLDVASIMSNENFLEISELATIEDIDVWGMVIAE